MKVGLIVSNETRINMAGRKPVLARVWDSISLWRSQETAIPYEILQI